MRIVNFKQLRKPEFRVYFFLRSLVLDSIETALSDSCKLTASTLDECGLFLDLFWYLETRKQNIVAAERIATFVLDGSKEVHVHVI